ncbi:MAG: hypothetical protein WCI34_05015, partial [Actinomycetes bacterium]
MIGVGLLCVALTVVFLTRAAVARGGKAPRIAVGVTLFGGVAMFVGYTLQGFALVSISSKFAKEGGLSYDEMQNLLKNPMRIVGSWAGLLGTLTLGFGFVMASLNAMRVGLLTRFLGYLGILAGVMIVLPLMGGLLLVQAFWLLAVAATIAGRWPGGRPPAWDDGEAHPWPSAAEVRAQAAEARELADSEKGASKNGKGA